MNKTYSVPSQFGPYIIPIAVQSVYLREACKRFGVPFTLPIVEWPFSNCRERLSSILKDKVNTSLVVTSIHVFTLPELEGKYIMNLLDKRDDMTIYSSLETIIDKGTNYRNIIEENKLYSKIVKTTSEEY
tara:strand:+ start:479 stop:868 length:390 start_codon:yes stop_codon:yes gene_type:complete